MLLMALAAISMGGPAFANEEMTNGASPRAEARANPVPEKNPDHRRPKRAKRRGRSTEGNPTPDSAGETKQQAAPVGNNHL